MTVLFAQNFESSKENFFTLETIEDCAGNSSSLNASFILPDIPEPNDVVINEILFDPLTGGSDYVEVYNRSEKVVDLFGWQFANIAGDSIANKKTINKHFILRPGQYVAVSKDTLNVQNNYPNHEKGRFIKSDLPSYNNDSGTVILISGVHILDRVSYSAKWHFALMDSDDGKSLERINANDPSQIADNWHTASEAMLFGTPGRENSQFVPVVASGEFSLTNKVFSPDNDGYEDVLQIRYKMSENDILATITIYDEYGRVIRKLKQNEYLATEGVFTWDGVNEAGLKASIGQYIIYFEAFRPDGGSIFREKKVCVLAGKI
jgi:gliding motility-associated-like protein